MKTCPRGHLTCWPYSCPVCKAQGLSTAHQERKTEEAIDRAIEARLRPKRTAANLLGKAHARARRKAA